VVNRRLLIGTFTAALLAFGISPAAADIIYDKNITALGQGFGAFPRLLTTERTGSDHTNPAGTESACDGNVSGALSTNDCLGTDASFDGNGYTVPNSKDAVNGPAKNSLASLSGFTAANQIVIIYNPSQTGDNPATNIQDITLKFYDSSNNLVISVDGGCGDSCTDTSADSLYFGDTGINLGNGGTGFALILDATQAAAVDAACGANLLGCTTLALEVTIRLANDGPDSFLLVNISDVCDPNIPGDCPGPTNVPEPLTLSLFGAGLAGAVGLFRRRKKSA
jgi:hypothetical protein